MKFPKDFSINGVRYFFIHLVKTLFFNEIS